MRTPKHDWRAIQIDYVSGLPLQTICNKHSVPFATLQGKVAKAKWAELRKSAAAVSFNKGAQDLETLGKLVRQRLAADALTTLERVEGYLMSDVSDETKREQVLGSVTKRAATVFGWSEESAPVQVNVALLGALNDRETQPVEV